VKGGYEEPFRENRKLAQRNWLVIGHIAIIRVLFGKLLLAKPMAEHTKYNEVDIFESPLVCLAFDE